MFNGGHLRIRGVSGSLVWVYHTAATLGAWAIAREPGPLGVFDPHGAWTLTATIVAINAAQVRQRPLRFTAPRLGLPPWCWPVQECRWTERTLVAVLGLPEQ